FERASPQNKFAVSEQFDRPISDTLVGVRRRDFVMTIDRRQFFRLGAGAVGMSILSRYAAGQEPGTAAADTLSRKLPIIDVHMHAYPADMVIEKSLVNPVTGKPPQIRNGEEHLEACLAEMKRLHVVKGIVSGGTGDRLAAAAHWHEV